jgi:histidyl-tRNA synthetase
MGDPAKLRLCRKLKYFKPVTPATPPSRASSSRGLAMNTKVQAPRGTADTLPADVWRWQAVEAIARRTAATFNFKEIRTPVFEHTELFHRGVGEQTDIVTKETFTFTDRGNESLTLRPEGTAGVARAMIEQGILNDQGARSKVYYIGPNFRYERPQKGRLRIHHQFGAEAFGIDAPEQDVECVSLQLAFYSNCGLKDLQLRVNSLGDRDSKLRYRDALVAYLTPKAAQLSDDSRRRLETNPLRILDSKDPRDIAAAAGAPPATESLSEKSRTHFDRAVALLSAASIPFVIDPALVRGFDYYTETLWEVTASGLGSQNAVGGGGRYDNLVEHLGGRPTPGVGFGCGLERLLIALESQGVKLLENRPPLVWVVCQGDAAQPVAWKLLADLRAAGIAADADLTGRGVKAQFKLADREGASHAIVIGDAEVADASVVLKDMTAKTETRVPRDEVVSMLVSDAGAAAPGVIAGG